MPDRTTDSERAGAPAGTAAGAPAGTAAGASGSASAHGSTGAASGAARRAIRAWCLYDVGNSAFITTVVAAILPIYFSTVAGAGLDPDPERARVLATSRWGLLNGLTLLIVAVGSPVLGTLADLRGARKRLLATCAVAGAVLTALLFLVERGDWILAAVLFGLAQVAFSWSIVMYDALLPQVAPRDQLDIVSSRGYAWGYLGGGLLLALQVAAISKPSAFGLSDAGIATRLSFVSVGIWWLVFTVPLMRHVRELPAARADNGNGVAAGSPQAATAPRLDRQMVRHTFKRLWHTLHELRTHREAFRFLLAFWLYNDGIGTIVRMATIFGAEVGVGRTTLIGGILLVQVLGFPFALLAGRLAGRVGAKRSVEIMLVGYVIACTIGYFMDSAAHFWVLAVLIGMIQGGSQALSRSLFASMIPPPRSGEFFGFYDVSAKFAGIVGPLVFGLTGALLGSSRYGVVVVLLFFVAGMVMLATVHPERARAMAQSKAAAAADA